MNTNLYKKIGIISAPLIPAFSLSLASPGLGVTYTDPSSILIWTMVLYFPSAFTTALFGIPIYCLLKHFSIVRWWSVSTFGLISGGLACSFFTGFRWIHRAQDYQGLMYWSVLGGITAYVIWFFWELTQNRTKK